MGDGHGTMKGAGRRTRSATPAASPPTHRSTFHVSSDHQSPGRLRRIVFKDLDDTISPPPHYRTSLVNTASSAPLHVHDPLSPVAQRRSSLPASFPRRNSRLVRSDKLLGRVHTSAGKCSTEAAAATLGAVHTPAEKCCNGSAGNSTSAILSNRLLGRFHTLASKRSDAADVDTQLGHVHTSSGNCCDGVAISNTGAVEGNRLLGRVHVPSSDCTTRDAPIGALADLVQHTKGETHDRYGHPFGVQQQRRFSSPAALPSSRAYACASSSFSSTSSSSSSSLLHNCSSRGSTLAVSSALERVQKLDCRPSFRRISIDNVVVSDVSPASTSSFVGKSTDPLNSNDDHLETRLHRMTLRSDSIRAGADQEHYYGDDDVVVKGKKTRKASKYHDDYDDFEEDSCDVENWHDKAEADNMHPIGLLCLVGLYNEGNTCYLNSCIQCLVHTMPLATAMLGGQSSDCSTNKGGRERRMSCRSPRRPSGSWLDNTDHSVSSRRSADAGRLATEYGNLLKDMWCSSRPPYSVASAAAFLRSLQSWEPQFSGYQQQDAQEAMRAILDGLHESLNRVRNRKYKDMYREYETRPAEELANIMWDYHRSLNDSIIQDIFCASKQYRMLRVQNDFTLLRPIFGLIIAFTREWKNATWRQVQGLTYQQMESVHSRLPCLVCCS